MQCESNRGGGRCRLPFVAESFVIAIVATGAWCGRKKIDEYSHCQYNSPVQIA